MRRVKAKLLGRAGPGRSFSEKDAHMQQLTQKDVFFALQPRLANIMVEAQQRKFNAGDAIAALLNYATLQIIDNLGVDVARSTLQALIDGLPEMEAGLKTEPGMVH